MLPGVGAAGQQKLLAARVVVIGAGGLGSPVLLYLAAAGVGKLAVVDDDQVALSNLQRQVLHGQAAIGEAKTRSAQARLGELNSDIQIAPYETRLGAENVGDIISPYDLVIDGSDNFSTRYLLNDSCVRLGKPLLYGALSQFDGQLSLFHAPTPAGQAPCYRCLFPDPPAPGSVPNCAEAGVFGALAGVIGSMMAVEAIKFLLGLDDSVAGTLLHYDARSSALTRIALRKRPDCPACGRSAVGQALAQGTGVQGS